MIRIKPIITEKSLSLAQGHWYSFIAPSDMTKSEFFDIINSQYNHAPLKINIVKRQSIQKRRGKHFFNTKKVKIFRFKMPDKVKIDGFEVSK